MMSLDDGPPTHCGAEHPRYKGVTCVRNGKCWGGFPHAGILFNPRRIHGEQYRFVYWGGASEETDRLGITHTTPGAVESMRRAKHDQA